MADPEQLITIVMPVYNRVDSVAAAIESVQTQDHESWELIVVDDASSDGSADVVGSLAIDDTRIRLITRTVNAGAQAARNIGIAQARGDWIAFLDSDDTYLPKSLSLRLDAAAKSGAAVIHSECLAQRGNAAPEPFGVRPLDGSIYADVLAQPGPVFPAILVRTEALAAIGGLDESIVSYQEWDTAIRLAKDNAFSFVPEPTFIYRLMGADSISRSLSRDGRGYEMVVAKHKDEILALLGRRGMAEHQRGLALRWRSAGSPVRAAGHAFRAVMWSPAPIKVNLGMIRDLLRGRV